MSIAGEYIPCSHPSTSILLLSSVCLHLSNVCHSCFFCTFTTSILFIWNDFPESCNLLAKYTFKIDHNSTIIVRLASDSSLNCFPSVAYLQFHKEGPNFLWPLMLTQRGPNHVFLFFSYGQKDFFGQRRPWSNGPPKYTTVPHSLYKWLYHNYHSIIMQLFRRHLQN